VIGNGEIGNGEIGNGEIGNGEIGNGEIGNGEAAGRIKKRRVYFRIAGDEIPSNSALCWLVR
jgi:hypothetical protein